MRGDVQAEALSVRKNNSTIQKLFWMVGSDVAAPVRALVDMVTRVWYVSSALVKPCLLGSALFSLGH